MSLQTRSFLHSSLLMKLRSSKNAISLLHKYFEHFWGLDLLILYNFGQLMTHSEGARLVSFGTLFSESAPLGHIPQASHFLLLAIYLHVGSQGPGVCHAMLLNLIGPKQLRLGTSFSLVDHIVMSATSLLQYPVQWLQSTKSVELKQRHITKT